MVGEGSRSDRRKVLKTLGVLGWLAAGGGIATATPGRDPDAERDELLVGIEPDADMATVESQGVSAASVETSVAHRNEELDYFAVELPDETADRAREAVRRAFRNRSGVAYVEENITYEAQLAPNDPRFDVQYAPQQVNAPEAWDTTLGSSDVTVAIVDTGIDYNHEDLTSLYGKGYDFISGDDDPFPDAGSSHGTHVAGCASADTDNGAGVAGISDSTLISCRCLGGGGAGSVSDIADGIQWAVDNGADIINLSLGGPRPSYTMENAVQYAADRGTVVVAAAGNNGRSVGYPAAFDDCIAVSALDPDENLAGFSSRGSNVDVAAPGVNILAPVPNDGYSQLSGTSMASPVAAGVAAIGKAADPGLSADELREELEASAADVGLPSRAQGAGRVDAKNLVDRVDDGGGGGDSGGGSGGGGGDDDRLCAITTVTARDEPTLNSLRRFRDESMSRTLLGRGLVGLYYRISPPIADTLARYPESKTARACRYLVHRCATLSNRQDETESTIESMALGAALTTIYGAGVLIGGGGHASIRAREQLGELRDGIGNLRDRIGGLRDRL